MPIVVQVIRETPTISLAGTIRITVSVTFTEQSSLTLNDLNFEWQVRNATTSGRFHTLDNIRSNRPSIAIRADTLGHGSFVFQTRVNVNNDRIFNAFATSGVQVFKPPSIDRVQINPQDGFAFTTNFTVSCESFTVAGIPLLYRFELASSSLPLSKYRTTNTLRGLKLPPGAVAVQCRVKDQFGGVATKNSTDVVIKSSQNPPKSNVSSCDQAAEVASHIKDIVIGLDVLPINEINALGAIAALQKGLATANAREKRESLLRSAAFSLDELESIPNGEKGIKKSCNSSLGFLPEKDASDEILTFADLGSMIWDSISSPLIDSIAQSSTESDAALTGFIIHTVGKLVRSSGATSNSSQLEKLSESLNSTIGASLPEEYLDTDLGVETGTMLSNLLQLVLTAPDSQAEKCTALDATISLTDDAFLRHIGTGLTPDEAPFLVSNEIFEASASYQFLDENTTAAINGSEVLAIFTGDKFQDDRSNNEHTSVLTLSTILVTGAEKCRATGPAFERISNITSLKSSKNPSTVTIIFANEAEVNDARDSLCQFWNATLGEWSSKGCRLEDEGKIVESTIICVCDHLTEFAVLRHKTESRGNDAENTISLIYIILIGVYVFLATFMTFMIRTMCRVRRTTMAKRRQTFRRIKWGFVFVQVILRIPLFFLLSGILKFFTVQTLPTFALVLLLGLPYTVMWAAFGLVLFQWSSVLYKNSVNEVSYDDIRNYRLKVLILSIILGTVIFGSFTAFFVSFGDPTLRLIGPIIMAVLTCVFAFSILGFGMKTAELIRNLQGDNNRSARLMGFTVKVLTVLMMIQSVAWILDLLMNSMEGGASAKSLLAGMVGFYVAEILIILTQLDSLQGSYILYRISHWTLKSYVYSSKPNSSDNSNRSKGKLSKNKRMCSSQGRPHAYSRAVLGLSDSKRSANASFRKIIDAAALSQSQVTSSQPAIGSERKGTRNGMSQQSQFSPPQLYHYHLEQFVPSSESISYRVQKHRVSSILDSHGSPGSIEPGATPDSGALYSNGSRITPFTSIRPRLSSTIIKPAFGQISISRSIATLD
mmetsp:Transcript_20475/g.50242  ORF Transcript_20475/g.50242 Transcript_20475/m.50242 type:complete len:1054 (-) Transcript_20475:79-3240(-)